MTTRQIFMIATAVVLIAVVICGVSAIRTYRSERRAANAIETADKAEAVAAAESAEANAFREKNIYLEKSIAEIRAAAKQQDEKLNIIRGDSDRLRKRVGDARGTRSIDTDADSLCRKLAELGHPC